jgi:hypothetical protein
VREETFAGSVDGVGLTMTEFSNSREVGERYWQCAIRARAAKSIEHKIDVVISNCVINLSSD